MPLFVAHPTTEPFQSSTNRVKITTTLTFHSSFVSSSAQPPAFKSAVGWEHWWNWEEKPLSTSDAHLPLTWTRLTTLSGRLVGKLARLGSQETHYTSTEGRSRPLFFSIPRLFIPGNRNGNFSSASTSLGPGRRMCPWQIFTSHPYSRLIRFHTNWNSTLINFPTTWSTERTNDRRRREDRRRHFRCRLCRCSDKYPSSPRSEPRNGTKRTSPSRSAVSFSSRVTYYSALASEAGFRFFRSFYSTHARYNITRRRGDNDDDRLHCIRDDDWARWDGRVEGDAILPCLPRSSLTSLASRLMVAGRDRLAMLADTRESEVEAVWSWSGRCSV